MSERKWAVTLPGKLGDILWAMPTVRAIARLKNQPIDIYLPRQFDGIAELLMLQSYVNRVFSVSEYRWPIRMESPIIPWAPEGFGSEVFHLGHARWPASPLYQQYKDNFVERYPDHAFGVLKHFDMKPWIEAPRSLERCQSCYSGIPRNSNIIFYGAGQDWIELKMGVLATLNKGLIGDDDLAIQLVDQPGGRQQEFAGFLDGEYVWFDTGGWMETAHLMDHCDSYVGCCAAQWVLACGIGLPCIMFDPAEGRHHSIFWWDGGGRNVKVLGGDGRPTWDARHVADAIRHRQKRKEG